MTASRRQPRRLTPELATVVASMVIPMSQLVLDSWNRFAEALQREVSSKISDAATAEDIVQEVFGKLATRPPRRHEPEALRAWLWRVARRAIVDRYRARRTAGTLSEEVEPVDPAIPSHSLDSAARELSRCMVRMMDGLSADDQVALRTADLEGRSQLDWARELGLSASGAKSRVQRARGRLKELVAKCCHVELDTRGGVIDYECRSTVRGCGCSN
jgi:RNA polymerase sigma-70 factor (ECF subfamily)